MADGARPVAPVSRNQLYADIRDTLYEGSCPMNVRKTLLASFSHYSAQMGQPDDKYIRAKTFYAFTIGVIPTLATRIVRIAITTLALPFRQLISIYRDSVYNVNKHIAADGREVNNPVSDYKRNWQKYTHEWVDLYNTGKFWVISGINTFSPGSFRETIKETTEYYKSRIDAEAADSTFIREKENHAKARDRAITAGVRARRAPVLPAENIQLSALRRGPLAIAVMNI